eukprot:1776346-Pyramimonas_sp.AAC.1
MRIHTMTFKSGSQADTSPSTQAYLPTPPCWHAPSGTAVHGGKEAMYIRAYLPTPPCWHAPGGTAVHG